MPESESVVVAEASAVNDVDPQLIYTFQEEGDIYLRVADLRDEGGPMHYYLLYVYELPFLHPVPVEIYEDCVTVPKYACFVGAVL